MKNSKGFGQKDTVETVRCDRELAQVSIRNLLKEKPTHRSLTPGVQQRRKNTSQSTLNETWPVSPGKSDTVNIEPLKKYALERLPHSSPLRDVLLAEDSNIDVLTFLARLKTWLQLSSLKR
jgi:hypothetical protein